MNRALFRAALLAAFLPALSGAEEIDLKGYVSAWTQDCKGVSCSLPSPGERNKPVSLRLSLPSSPGEAASAVSVQELAPPSGPPLRLSLSFFAICPYVSSGCAGRYFQVQAVLSGPAGAFCAAAFNLQDFSPFPVVMCAGAAPGGSRFGVTLHRNPF